MLEQRSLKLDLVALALLALTVFLALALFTYDPADPPGRLVYPPSETAHNVCGRVGAYLSHGLLTALGLGAYYLVVSGIVCSAALLGCRAVNEPITRGLGWSLSLGGFATLVALALPGWSPGPVIGSGGYLGAALGGFLQMHFASAGAYVLSLSVLAGGLLLATDYVLVRVVAHSLHLPARGMSHGWRKAHATYREVRAHAQTRRRLATDLEDDIELDEADEAQPLAIRIGGKVVEDSDEERDEEEESVETSADDETQTSEETATSAAAAVEEPGPRVKKPKKKNERQELFQAIEEASRRPEDTSNYELPSLELLLESEPIAFDEHEKDVRRKARILEKTFLNFGFQVKVVEIETGPVIAQFEVELEAGLRLSKITSLADDLAIALRVPSVRIVAPIPGKNTVGIEVPNNERQLVRLREVMEETTSHTTKMRIPVFLGKDVAGKPMVVDLTSLPHLLIAGRTGTGKSVCLNTIIMSLLMTRRPDEVKMLLIDPKMVELTPYTRIPHLMHPVVTDMKKAEAILAWAVDKMEERYALLARAGVRHISVYNQLGEDELMDRLQPENEEEKQHIPLTLPYIVIVADEMADLMMTAPKEVESHIIRLAQKSRAVGIHLVLATQKPTVDVITGLIKSNLPARIAFQVASRTDSRVVLDEMGADKLLGNGDLLFLWPGTSTLLRGQGAYVSDDEINRVTSSVATHEPQFVHELVHLPVNTEGQKTGSVNAQRDELYNAAVEIVIGEGRGSVSLLQRALGIGYGRAARLIDYMAEDGVVGQYNGSQARDVLISLDEWRAMTNQAAEADAPTSAPPRKRGNRISPNDDDSSGGVSEPAPRSVPRLSRTEGPSVPGRPPASPLSVSKPSAGPSSLPRGVSASAGVAPKPRGASRQLIEEAPPWEARAATLIDDAFDELDDAIDDELADDHETDDAESTLDEELDGETSQVGDEHHDELADSYDETADEDIGEDDEQTTHEQTDEEESPDTQTDANDEGMDRQGEEIDEDSPEDTEGPSPHYPRRWRRRRA